MEPLLLIEDILRVWSGRRRSGSSRDTSLATEAIQWFHPLNTADMFTHKREARNGMKGEDKDHCMMMMMMMMIIIISIIKNSI